MNLNITGRHFEITPALKKHIEDKFIKINNHFDHVINAKFILSVEKFDNIVDATIHLPHLDINAKSVDEDMYKSIDLVINRLDRQVIKYKEKNKDHHQSEGSIKNKASD
ncbi:MAG: putative sigma-54 modulation protein [Methylophilaceae bacterium]|jgi:putative sigma-54 modulation protein|tara:strand:- start:230 stop:556 length:327 start_codon:yes stop_codon:yes gene_type:complete